jgi:hypothetical protein
VERAVPVEPVQDRVVETLVPRPPGRDPLVPVLRRLRVELRAVVPKKQRVDADHGTAGRDAPGGGGGVWRDNGRGFGFLGKIRVPEPLHRVRHADMVPPAGVSCMARLGGPR